MNFSKNNVVINTLAKKKILILRILLAIIFALSFIYKMLSHEDFTDFITIVLKCDPNLSIYLSDIVLGIELYLMLQLLFSDNKISAIMQSLVCLIIFSLFLIYLIIKNNTENCFCFGTFLPLSPINSLFKNIIIILVAFFIIKKDLKKNRMLIQKIDLIKLLFVTGLMVIVFPTPRNAYSIDVEPMGLNQFQDLLAQKKLLVIDARSKQEFDESHIPTAINIPFRNQNFREISETLIENNKNKTIIVYCSSKICSLAKKLAIALKKRYSLDNIFYLQGGIEAWSGQL